MYGLIIKKKWLELILNGKKNLEIRGSDTKHINEPIALIESGSGLVIGTAVISGTFPLYGSNKAWFENCWEQLKNYNDTKNKNCHIVQISYDELIKRYKKPHAWQLDNVKRLEKPVHYEHPQGAVIWVNLYDLLKNIELEEER